MRCPSCGKNTPDYGAYCLNCGATIASHPAPARNQPTDCEYEDFVWDFPPKSMWAKIGSGAYTEAGAKLEFWQNYRRDILAALRKWEDDGWEPTGPVDSGCIEIRTVSDFRGISGLGWLLIIFVSLASWGLLLLLFLIFGRSTYAEPVRCVVPMRREKQAISHLAPSALPNQPMAKGLPSKLPHAAFPSVQLSQQMKFCPRCAHMNRTGAKFCSRCGETL